MIIIIDGGASGRQLSEPGLKHPHRGGGHQHLQHFVFTGFLGSEYVQVVFAYVINFVSSGELFVVLDLVAARVEEFVDRVAA